MKSLRTGKFRYFWPLDTNYVSRCRHCTEGFGPAVRSFLLSAQQDLLHA
jgi:hypothetical protein